MNIKSNLVFRHNKQMWKNLERLVNINIYPVILKGGWSHSETCTGGSSDTLQLNVLGGISSYKIQLWLLHVVNSKVKS